MPLHMAAGPPTDPPAAPSWALPACTVRSGCLCPRMPPAGLPPGSLFWKKKQSMMRRESWQPGS